MDNISVGSKLYHYYYGTMTIVSLIDKYIEVTFDSPRDDYPIPGTGSGDNLFSTKFLGHLFFDDPSLVGTESYQVDHSHTHHEFKDQVAINKFKPTSQPPSLSKKKESKKQSQPLVRINFKIASPEQLVQAKYINQSIAEGIVALREAGDFNSLDDLSKVTGVGETTMKNIISQEIVYFE